MERPRHYLDDRGRLLFVTHGIGSPPVYFTCHQRPSGGKRRYKSRNLPPRDIREEAQSDLDAHAVRMGWREIEPI